MSQLAFLIQDVFTFLSFLSADDLRPLGSRYLSPSALAKLAGLLIVSDPIAIKQPHNSTGHWRTGARVRSTERQTERIRFVHYLAESAHLVARTGAFLKPTPLTARWLTATDQGRAHLLFRAAFPAQPSPDDNQRWRAFGLPGNHLVSPLATLNQLFEILRQVPIDYRVKITTLLKLLALPSYDDDSPNDQPATILCNLLKLLQWFEIIAGEIGSIQLTGIGATLLEHAEGRDAKPLASTYTLRAKPLHWSKSRGDLIPDLSAPLDADLALLLELGEYATHLATLSSARQTRRLYQLDAARVQRALDRGTLRTITQVHEFLERATNDALPRTVTSSQ